MVWGMSADEAAATGRSGLLAATGGDKGFGGGSCIGSQLNFVKVVGLVASRRSVALRPSLHAAHSTTRAMLRPLREPSHDAHIGLALACHGLALSLRCRELAQTLNSAGE